tara:strand:+ start:152 stop:1054 length:903 start_codon:yes stop_codon:yes gene_type:complete
MKKIIASFYNPDDKSPPICFKQTIEAKGILKNVEFTNNNQDADVHIVGTWVNKIDDIKGKKIIYIQQEPPEVKLPNKDVLDYSQLAISPFDIDHNIKQIIAPPVLQWTYDINAEMKKNVGHKYSFSEKSSNLEDKLYADIPQKTKLCSMIVSSKALVQGQRDRINFTADIMEHFKNKIDYYGFGIKELKNKKDAIDPYLFSIAIENSQHENYWTEKIADVYLGHTMPIYHGCANIDNYFPSKSLVKINIYNKDEAIAKIEDCLNNPSEVYNPAVFDARRKILLEYNMFKMLEVGINQVIH